MFETLRENIENQLLGDAGLIPVIMHKVLNESQYFKNGLRTVDLILTENHEYLLVDAYKGVVFCDEYCKTLSSENLSIQDFNTGEEIKIQKIFIPKGKIDELKKGEESSLYQKYCKLRQPYFLNDMGCLCDVVPLSEEEQLLVNDVTRVMIEYYDNIFEQIQNREELYFKIIDLDNALQKNMNNDDIENQYDYYFDLYKDYFDIDVVGLIEDINERYYEKSQTLNDIYGIKYLENNSYRHLDKNYDKLFIQLRNGCHDLLGYIGLTRSEQEHNKNIFRIHSISVKEQFRGMGLTQLLYEEANRLAKDNNFLIYSMENLLSQDGQQKLQHKTEKLSNMFQIKIYHDGNHPVDVLAYKQSGEIDIKKYHFCKSKTIEMSDIKNINSINKLYEKLKKKLNKENPKP